MSSSEDITSSEAEIRKRVNPNSGSAAFELKKPAWYSEKFRSAFRFHSSEVGFGVYERVAGNYTLESATLNRGGLSLGSPMAMQVPLEQGFISVYEPAGISVRYTRQINAGNNRVLGIRGTNISAVDYHTTHGFWIALFDGSFTVATSATPKQTFNLAEGQLKEIVLPTATLNFAFETIDPLFLGTNGCLRIRPRFANPDAPLQESVAELDVVRDAAYTLPAGDFASLDLSACGVSKTLKLSPDAALTVAVHRLEVNDVDVVSPDGTHKLVRGRFVVAVKLPNGSYADLFSGATHTGVDLTEGVYRVTSTAANAPPHVVEVTF